MIARDRALLARLRHVNQHLGDVVLALMACQDGGELPADGCRALGEHLTALGHELVARADELDALDGQVVTATTRREVPR
ncbi:hypothetical protein B0I33_102606 [Prauserella shujinwangii]|uniref:Uncharacterized protein n=1 Tax=Prauserella shujinwangii TaxID=1453103 RepID=A0A2T0M1K3_9PSEU|nr:hypothetical protein [Prauserella shujinwangii]PRX50484.1 hypothetical protein B0I33_102606 [Prauserella shujinwangii]